MRHPHAGINSQILLRIRSALQGNKTVAKASDADLLRAYAHWRIWSSSWTDLPKYLDPAFCEQKAQEWEDQE